MNLARKLADRAEAGKPVRVGLIGAGKFGTMFLAQARRTPGLHVMGVADLSPPRAQAALALAGWPAEQYQASSFGAAYAAGATHLTDDAMALIAADGIDVIIDATGNPLAGIAHVLACCTHHRHVVMVNVEADALAGPALAQRAAAAGIVYSLAYGDQPALIAEQVDWARAAGFAVVAAGKGTRYRDGFHFSTPATVWQHYGITEADAAAGRLNPQMFNSFLDGTKSAIEMAAVANATGLAVPRDGLAFPACGVDDLPELLKPRAQGGVLEQAGMVEVVASEARDGAPIFRDLRWGVYTVFEAPDDYVKRCFQEYGLKTDSTGRYAAMYKPYHLIGLELGISVASVALRGEPTGAPRAWIGDVAAIAKRDLAAGESLDGEGGFTVYGRLMPAQAARAGSVLPIGLAHGAHLQKSVPRGGCVRLADVQLGPEANLALSLRSTLMPTALAA